MGENNRFQMIAVGQLLEDGITSYKEHGAVDFWGGGAGIYTIFIDDPTKEELKELLDGKITLGIMPIKFIEPIERTAVEKSGDFGKYLHQFWHSLDTILIFFKFGKMGWGEAPFHIALCLDEDMKNTGFKELEEGMGYSIQVIVVNARNGIVEGLRVFACPREFCLLLKGYTKNQIETTNRIGFDKDEYEKWIFKLYSQFTIDQLANKCKSRFGVMTQK